MRVLLDLPKESAELLISMYINEDTSLQQFSIQKVEIQRGSESGDSEQTPEESRSLLDKLNIDIENPLFRGKLRRTIIAYFSDSDLRNICYDLGIDYENLPAEGKDARVRELLVQCERMGMLELLVNACVNERPHIDLSL